MSRWRDYLTGFCQAFTLFPDPEDFQGYPHKNEDEAIRGDWQKVGDAMRKVVGELEKTIAEEARNMRHGRMREGATTDDYRKAMDGKGDFGSLGYEWSDKPHRLVYDLCGEVDAKAAQIAKLTEALQGIIDWADFAMNNPGEFNSHGVRNLESPPPCETARHLLKEIK